MKPEIHPTAIVAASVELGEGTTVGPYAIIEDGAKIGKNCRIQQHVSIRGEVELKDRVQVFPYACVGFEPQHLKYQGEKTTVTIGEDTVLREYVSVHRGTHLGSGSTRIGERCLIMAYCHVAHDCRVGNDVILANDVQMAGHSVVEDHATIGGHTGITQFCRVGKYAYVGASTIIRKDIPPFMLGKGHEFSVSGVNAIGLSRKNFSDATILQLKRLYKIFYMQNHTTEVALKTIMEQIGDTEEIRYFIDFVQSSKMGLVR